MSPVQIELRDSSFDSFQELIEHRKTISEIDDHGACSIFVGTMREYNGGDRVFSMQLEHYPGMTEKQLEEIVGEACKSCLLYTSPSPRDLSTSRMPSSA